MNADLKLLNQSNIAIEFFRSNLDKITNDFNNQFVAIKEKEIIENGKTMEEVLSKLKKKGEDNSNLVIKFVSKNIFIL